MAASLNIRSKQCPMFPETPSRLPLEQLQTSFRENFDADHQEQSQPSFRENNR